MRSRLRRVAARLFPAPAAPVPAPPGLVSVAPFNGSLYRYALAALKGAGATFVTSDQMFCGRDRLADAPLVHLRHDVDFSATNLSVLISPERQLGIRSDIHLMVDGGYDLPPLRDYLTELREEGFVIGLHTLAAIEDDFYSVLRREIDRFQAALGFAPATFSVHGPSRPPLDWQARRSHFLSKIGTRLSSFGFFGSTGISGVDRWMEDTGFGGEFAYLRDEWADPPLVPGQVLGILTHPLHWIDWPVAWHYNPDEVKEHPLLAPLVSRSRGVTDRNRD